MVIASVYKWEKEKLDKKGQNEQDLASPVIVALRRGITELRVGNVQVISESDPNPHTEIRKTLCEPASSQSLAPRHGCATLVTELPGPSNAVGQGPGRSSGNDLGQEGAVTFVYILICQDECGRGS